VHQFSTSDTIIVLCNLNRLCFFLTPSSWCLASFEIGTNKGGCSGCGGCGRRMDKGAFVPLGGVAGATGFFRTLVSGRKNGDVSPPLIPFPFSVRGWGGGGAVGDVGTTQIVLFPICFKVLHAVAGTETNL